MYKKGFLTLGLVLQTAMVQAAVSTAKENLSAKAAIKKAQDLTLEQNRQEAVETLIRALNKETNARAKRELLSSLNELSTIFYTEKTQKLFEYARSLFRDSKAEAMEKLEAAKQLEPDNNKIELWLSRGYLQQGKCEQALEVSQKAVEKNPYFTAGDLVKVQAQICLQKGEALLQEDEELKKIEATFPMYYQLLMAQQEINNKNYLEAEIRLKKAEQLDKNFPEIYYWKTRALEKQGKDIKETASRYVRSCKGLSKADYLKYEYEPRTCIELAQFEKEYKKIIEEEGKKEL